MITSSSSTTTTTTTTTTSPVIIPISSVLHVLGRNYDESILLTSKYNQVIFLFYIIFIILRIMKKKKKRIDNVYLSVLIKLINFGFDL
jgi:Na+-driven multidrug efflux pump